jgi:formate hydrogenlyase subunit 3/multisubunit Na+/H+ antiporter MnhD subunit
MIDVTNGFLLAAIVVIFAGAPLAIISRRVAYGATLVGAVLLLLSASRVLLFGSSNFLTWPSPIGEMKSIGLDGLSAYFALVAAVVWIGTSGFSLFYDKGYSRLLAVTYAITLGSIVLLLTAGDSLLFLVGWETMTLASFGMILQAKGKTSRIFSAAFIFLAFGEASTLFVILALAGLRGGTGTFVFTLLSQGGLLANGIFLAALIGFGLKMGVAPFHMSEWLPIAHSSAPSNASAVLSATLTLAGIYGLFRIVMLLGTGPIWWGALMIAIGAIATLLGALFASVSDHIKGLPAYSTIENNGLVLVALGVALIARSEGLLVLFGFALYAAFFQVFSHAIAKAVLFLSSGYIDRTAGMFDMNSIKGKAKDPGGPAFSGTLTAAMSLAAAPPMAGFVSEWMILESLFQSFRFSDPLIRFLGLMAGAAVALAGGLIMFAMVKFLGFSQLWNPDGRKSHSSQRRLGLPILGLAGVVLGLGIASPWVLQLASSPVNTFARGSLSPPLSLSNTLDIPQGWSILSGDPFGIISPPGIAIAIVVGMIVGLGYFALGGKRAWRRSPPWMAGNEGQPSRETYSSFGFSTGIRVMFKSLLRTHEVRIHVEPVTPTCNGSQNKYYVELEVIDVFKAFYDNLVNSTHAISAALKSAIMPGRMGQYVAYILVTLLAVILYVTLAY